MLPLWPLLLHLLSYASATVEAVEAHSCAPSSSSSSSKHCPPFKSSVPFPFSPYPGCGHPSFQIECSANDSTISINNVTYTLLRHDPNTTTLRLSPKTTTPLRTDGAANCSSLRFSSVPRHSINFSGSPFRVSDSSCSRLSVLRPCTPLNLPNCSQCPWDCSLAKNPARILGACERTRRLVPQQGCQGDLLGFLESFFSKWGVEVEWDEAQDPYFAKCRNCTAKKGACGFNSSDPSKSFLCFQSRSTVSPVWVGNHDSPITRVAILCLIFSLTCLLLAISITIAIFRSRRQKSAVEEEDPATLFLRRHRSASLLPPVFSFGELEAATNEFDPKRKIGDGGFGSVYLGQLSDGRIVAVKYLHRHNNAVQAKAFSTKSFCNEILILSTLNHPNLLKLHGYCSDPKGLLLVHDYVSNGTLADHLHGRRSLYRRKTLTWQVRLDVALQTALALEYLHFSVVPPIVHRDITSSNIFLDKDMRVKVGDFGLSRLLVLTEPTPSSSAVTDSSGCVWTGPQGTPGYLDPDYHRSFRLTEKSDVYSYGIVLFELITGMKAVDQRREKREMALVDLVVSKIQMCLLHQVVDPVLAVETGATDGGSGVSAVAELAFRCVAADKDDRPDAREIVEEIRRIRGSKGGIALAASWSSGDDVGKR